MDENIVIKSVKTGEIYKLKGDVQQAFAFRDHVKNLLYAKTGVDVATVPDDEAIKSIQYLQDVYTQERDGTLSDKAIESMSFKDRVKAILNKEVGGDLSLTDDDAIEFIRYLIRNQSQKQEENLVDNSYIVIENLQHELRIANKVIACLVEE